MTTLPTGTCPVSIANSTERLRILSLPVGGLTWEDAIQAIANAIIAQQPDIVSTSLGFLPPEHFLPPEQEIPYYTRAQRILLAFHWRARVLASGQSSLHVTAAGNDFANTNAIPAYDRVAEFSSPWNLAARRGSIEDMVLGDTEITAAEEFSLQNVVWSLPANLRLYKPLNNVVIVGSIDPDGIRSSFWGPGFDGPGLRALAGVFGPVC